MISTKMTMSIPSIRDLGGLTVDEMKSKRMLNNACAWLTDTTQGVPSFQATMYQGRIILDFLFLRRPFEAYGLTIL